MNNNTGNKLTLADLTIGSILIDPNTLHSYYGRDYPIKWRVVARNQHNYPNNSTVLMSTEPYAMEPYIERSSADATKREGPNDTEFINASLMGNTRGIYTHLRRFKSKLSPILRSKLLYMEHKEVTQGEYVLIEATDKYIGLTNITLPCVSELSHDSEIEENKWLEYLEYVKETGEVDSVFSGVSEEIRYQYELDSVDGMWTRTRYYEHAVYAPTVYPLYYAPITGKPTYAEYLTYTYTYNIGIIPVICISNDTKVYKLNDNTHGLTII